MKRIHLMAHGRPEEACSCLEVEEPGDPGPGELLVEILAAAINPADLLIFEGRYPGPQDLPAPVGIEGAGRVISLGEGVEGFAPGDLVMSLGRANWCERLVAPANTFIPLPSDLNLDDAAQMKANPPSAHLMLSESCPISPGDWVIQNAANSAVGRHVIRLAKAMGLKTASIVRRPSLVPELQALGGDLVLVDSDGLAKDVRQATGKDANIVLAIDAVAGESCLRLADCLSNGGTVVNYGFLSGDPCMLTPTHTIVEGKTLKGFWLVGFMRNNERQTIVDLYHRLSGYFIDGTLTSPVEARYHWSQVGDALAHAAQEGRNGKVLFCA